jgi:hypothetical protein
MSSAKSGIGLLKTILPEMARPRRIDRRAASSLSVSRSPDVGSIPPILPPRTTVPLNFAAATVSETASEDIFKKLNQGEYSIPLSELEQALMNCLDLEDVRSVPLVGIRAGLLHFSRHLSAEALIVCLDLFGRGEFIDHQFFKEIGKALYPKVDELSVTQISSLLRSHAMVGATESDLFGVVCARLASVINRANMQLIREILVSLSLLEGQLVDSSRMVELCLNRYSLCTKDEMSVDIDKDVLVALARLRINNPRIIKRCLHRIFLNWNRLSIDALIQVLGSATVLGCETSQLWRLVKMRYFKDVSAHSSCVLSDLVSLMCLVDPEFTIQAACVVADQLSSSDELSFNDTIVSHKVSWALACMGLSIPTRFESILGRLSLDDLRSLESLLVIAREKCEVKSPLGVFISSKQFSLSRKQIQGLFATQMVDLKTTKK